MPDNKLKRDQQNRYRARALYSVLIGLALTAISALLPVFFNNPGLGLVPVLIVITSILSLLYYSTVNLMKSESKDKEDDLRAHADVTEEATYQGIMRAFRDAGMISNTTEEKARANLEINNSVEIEDSDTTNDNLDTNTMSS